MLRIITCLETIFIFPVTVGVTLSLFRITSRNNTVLCIVSGIPAWYCIVVFHPLRADDHKVLVLRVLHAETPTCNLQIVIPFAMKTY